MRLFLFALLFRFDKKLFYPFVLRTISTFNRYYTYCVVARSVVNIQRSTSCLIACFPGMTSLLPKVNRSSGAYFQTFFLNFSYFLMFLNTQIDLIILDTDVEQFTLTTKKITAYHL